MKNFIRRPSTVYFLFYFLLISLFRWEISLGLLLMWVGGVVGMLFEWVDRIFYVYFTKPHEQLSFQVRSLVKQKRYREALKLIDQRKYEQRHLTVRSLLFILVWILAAFFVLTSTGSALASGMVMSIGLSIFIDMLRDWKNMEKLKGWLFWQIRNSFSDKETKGVVIGFGVVFLLLTVMLI
jgi:hypothetical protein